MLSGDTIDNYTLLEQIGEGGFGVVYLAQQVKPVRRRVALKIIKVGMDTKQVIARFEAERQALAMMDHPNIAKVLDAGATESGRPYFVMELVEGERITEYCDRESLTTRDRLDLFTATCRAVQHAHQKGIIHRDLKPSNVLVTLQDGKPVPKVIDFGIAKATAARLTEQTMFTEMGQMVGTPAYMSPEQAGMTTVDIDTRSDVYSLGVLLYELLTGTTPFESIALRRASLAEMQRIIREEEPPRPSVRLSALAALHSQDRRASAPAASATPTVVKTVITGPRSATDVSGSSPTPEVIARMRRTEPRVLTRYLRGDLDWIIMKALEKERERRYETANGFAADIERFLEGEPVGAAPPSAAYRMRKFIRRNRAGVTAVALVTVTLVLGVVGTTWGMIAANVQRDRALHAEGEASRRADEFQQVADFQATMLSEIEPAQAGATVMDDILARFGAVLEKQEGDDAERGARAQAFERELRLVNATAVAAAMLDDTVLTPALRTIERDFADQPAVQASLLMTVGNSYRSLGRYEDALARLRWVAQVRERVLGARHPDTLEARSAVGGVLTSLQRLDEAEAELQVVVAESKRLLGADDPQSLRAQASLARLLQKLGRYDECEALCRDTLERRRRLLGDEDQLTIRSKIDLGFLLTARGKFSESEVLLREALETARRVSGEDHPDLIDIYSNLRSALQNLDRPAEAEPFAREAVELSQRVLGEDHPLALIHLVNMANLLQVLGRPAEAEPIAREVLERTRRIRGTQHRETLVAMNVVGLTLAMQGRYAEVEPFWRETLAIGRRVLGEDHPDTLTFLNNLSGLLKLLGAWSEAEELKREALDKSIRVLGEDHPTSLFIAHGLATILKQQARYDEAESLLRETIEKRTRVLGPDHTGTIDSMVELGELLLLDGAYVEAEEILRECHDRRARLKGDDHWSTVNAQSMLGAALAGQARFAEAEPLLVESHARLDPPPRGAHLRVKALERIVDLYQAWDAAEPGKGHGTKASEWQARLDEASQPDG